MKQRVLQGALIVLALIAPSNFADGRELIWTGWDIPTPADFKANLAEFEKLKLFDGSAIVPTRQLANGAPERVSDTFTNAHWDWSEFERAVSDLKSAKAVQCTNNFLMLTANPGNVDWFDDAGWAEVTDHWRLLARVAQQGGLSGLLFDPEPYRKPWSQFLYSAQASKTNHSFAQMQAKARQRGREVMKAIAAEYPAMTIFAYRLFSDLLRSGDPSKAGANLATDRFGLLPAFIDGWCDAMPPSITLIDGNEAGFSYQKTDRYDVAFARIKNQAPRFVSPENRAKIRGQLLVSQGIYLDPLLSGNATGGASVNGHLLTFVTAAFEAADGFVWIYGEKGKFWASGGSQPSWAKKMPGIEGALRTSKDPTKFAGEFLAGSQGKNLLRDAGFSEGDWSKWQESGSKGSATLGGGVAKLTGMKYGTVGQYVPVKAGQAYIVSAKTKQTGAGTAGLLINWRGSASWVAQNEIVEFGAGDSADASGWRTIVGLVTVPEEADQLVFLCFARGQESDGSEALFKDPQVVRASQ